MNEPIFPWHVEGMTDEQLSEALGQAIQTEEFKARLSIDADLRGAWLPGEANAWRDANRITAERLDKLQRAIREALEELDRNSPGAARQVLQWALTL